MSCSVNLLFPGQGSQYVGMGKFLPKHIRDPLYAEADHVLNFSLSSFMLKGPLEKLQETAITQPAILTYSIALLKSFLPKDLKIQTVLGHSVGEYTALVVAGAITFKDALRLVHRRGLYMQQATPPGFGCMYALIKVSRALAERACAAATGSEPHEIVMPANFNSPEQIVISGKRSAVLSAVDWLKREMKTNFKAVELKVSTPFHSSLMKPAALQLHKDLASTPFKSLKIPYIANVDAMKYDVPTSTKTIKHNLFTQVDHNVLWSQSFEQIDDPSRCIEIGPGKVLTSLARKINKEITCLSLDDHSTHSQVKRWSL